MPLRLRLRDDLYPATWANVEMKKVKRAVNFLKCALRCASSHQGQKRACWEQLRASLRRKEDVFQASDGPTSQPSIPLRQAQGRARRSSRALTLVLAWTRFREGIECES
jgi:hypothetical protein